MSIFIIDINGKERRIKDNVKVIDHVLNSDCLVVKKENDQGELIEVKEKMETEKTEKFVEVEIEGKKRTWKEWYPLKDFKQFNPGFNDGINN